MFPMVIHGPSGSGKTHVARGLALAWKQVAPEDRHFRYLTATDYYREYTDACQTNTLEDFRNAFHETTFLVLDDLEKIRGKRPAQAELVATLDAILRNGGRVVVSMTDSPGITAKDLDQRLAARLAGGLVVPLSYPGKDARRHLLTHWAKQQQVVIEPDAMEALATEIPVSVPVLRGAFHRLSATAQTKKRRIDIAMVRRLIAHDSQGRTPSPNDIVRAVAKQFSIHQKELKGKSRKRATVIARSAAMYLLRKLTDLTLKEIGAQLGDKDHRTVTHALRMTEKRIEEELDLRRTITLLERELAGAPTR